MLLCTATSCPKLACVLLLAVHELSAEPMDAMLDFFEGSAVSDESPLHARHPFVEIPLHVSGGGPDAAAVAAALHADAQSESSSGSSGRNDSNLDAQEHHAQEHHRHEHKHKHHSHAHSLGEVHPHEHGSVPSSGGANGR